MRLDWEKRLERVRVNVRNSVYRESPQTVLADSVEELLELLDDLHTELMGRTDPRNFER